MVLTLYTEGWNRNKRERGNLNAHCLLKLRVFLEVLLVASFRLHYESPSGALHVYIYAGHRATLD